MANENKAKFIEALKRVPKEKFGADDILAHDLAEKIGSLEDKEKITIRLDVRILDAAKNEANKLGVGYQKIINDRLLETYSIEEASYLRNDSVLIRELSRQVEALNERLNVVERIKEKKRA